MGPLRRALGVSLHVTVDPAERGGIARLEGAAIAFGDYYSSRREMQELNREAKAIGVSDLPGPAR